MKNDTTSTVLNFVLAVLVILGVVFAWFSIKRQHDLRAMQQNLQGRVMILQNNTAKAQQLAYDAQAFNKQSPNPELTRILLSAQPQPAAK
jgi:regulatory protein YycH of two-component signal transduction system YycFG